MQKNAPEPTLLGVSMPVHATKAKSIEVLEAWKACLHGLRLAARRARSFAKRGPSAGAKSSELREGQGSPNQGSTTGIRENIAAQE